MNIDAQFNETGGIFHADMGEEREISDVEQIRAEISTTRAEDKKLYNNLYANALRGTAAGPAIRLTDVSPNEHTVTVKIKRKNLFDKDNANILHAYFDKAIDASALTRSVWIPCSPNSTYTVYKMQSARFVVGFTSEEPAIGVTVHSVIVGNTGTQITNTSGENAKYIVVYLYHSSYDTTVTVDEILASLQIEESSTATAYTPYISDLTSVNVTACGKNLFDNNIPINSYELRAGGYNSYSWFVGIGTTVTFSLPEKPYLGNNGYMYVHPTSSPKADSKAKWLAHQTIDSLCNQTATVTSEDGYVTLMLTEEAYSNYVSQLQLELGSTVTLYEPYHTATAYTPTADGTVEDVTSISPDMTLMTDTAGITVDCEYNRDINKAFAMLEPLYSQLSELDSLTDELV